MDTSPGGGHRSREKPGEQPPRRPERRNLGKNPYGLTIREIQVLQRVVAGKTNKEIATEFVISVLTVNKHVSTILRKMGAASRTEAGVRAFREGLVD